MKYFSGGRKYYNVWCWATMCVPPESTCLATPPVRPPSLMVASLETVPNPSSIPTWFVPASGAPPHLTKVCSVRAPVLNPVTPTRTTLALFPVWTRPLLPGYFWHYFPFFVILLECLVLSILMCFYQSNYNQARFVLLNQSSLVSN